MCQLQRLCFKHWPVLRELALSNCGSVEKREVLRRHLAGLSEEEMRFLVTKQLRLVADNDPWAQDPAFLSEVGRGRTLCGTTHRPPHLPWPRPCTPAPNPSPYTPAPTSPPLPQPHLQPHLQDRRQRGVLLRKAGIPRGRGCSSLQQGRCGRGSATAPACATAALLLGPAGPGAADVPGSRGATGRSCSSQVRGQLVRSSSVKGPISVE